MSREPDWVEDGISGWMLPALDVEADPTGTGPGTVRLSEVNETMSPAQARELAVVLMAAADVAERVTA